MVDFDFMHSAWLPWKLYSSTVQPWIGHYYIMYIDSVAPVRMHTTQDAYN